MKIMQDMTGASVRLCLKSEALAIVSIFEQSELHLLQLLGLTIRQRPAED